MNFIYEKLNSISQRWRYFRYGITFLKFPLTRIPEQIKINGHWIKAKFNEPDSNPFLYEFTEICINDGYRVALLKKILGKVNTIVDIGANQGLFLFSARQHFPDARLVGYEPNILLKDVLIPNALALNAEIYFEAVAGKDCRMELITSDSDLLSKVVVSESGNIVGTSFKKMIDSAGGEIDILKIDCEGGEWDLFEDTGNWKFIRSFTMEYHLWAKQGLSIQHLFDMVRRLGFCIIFHNPISRDFGILTAISEKEKYKTICRNQHL